MAKPQQPQESFAEMFFPLKGIDLSQPLEEQPEQTTPTGQNVRAFEPTTRRLRGGGREGLSRYVNATVAGNNLIQDLNFVVHTSASAVGTGGGYTPPGTQPPYIITLLPPYYIIGQPQPPVYVTIGNPPGTTPTGTVGGPVAPVIIIGPIVTFPTWTPPVVPGLVPFCVLFPTFPIICAPLTVVSDYMIFAEGTNDIAETFDYHGNSVFTSTSFPGYQPPIVCMDELGFGYFAAIPPTTGNNKVPITISCVDPTGAFVWNQTNVINGISVNGISARGGLVLVTYATSSTVYGTAIFKATDGTYLSPTPTWANSDIGVNFRAPDFPSARKCNAISGTFFCLVGNATGVSGPGQMVIYNLAVSPITGTRGDLVAFNAWPQPPLLVGGIHPFGHLFGVCGDGAGNFYARADIPPSFAEGTHQGIAFIDSGANASWNYFQETGVGNLLPDDICYDPVSVRVLAVGFSFNNAGWLAEITPGGGQVSPGVGLIRTHSPLTGGQPLSISAAGDGSVAYGEGFGGTVSQLTIDLTVVNWTEPTSLATTFIPIWAFNWEL